MRKLFLFLVVFVTTSLWAQKDITHFMGIPVDGYKPEMIRRLKAKGFVSSAQNNEILQGEFNGTNVSVYVVTNNNKVYRIMLCDDNYVDETSIKIRFNKLCQQFSSNSKYICLKDYTIPEDEDISYGISVESKRYEAVFYQKSLSMDSVAVANQINEILKKKYTDEEINNPTPQIKEDIIKITFDFAFDLLQKKSVWFMISEHYGKYYITMFYDNEYNRANGEDL